MTTYQMETKSKIEDAQAELLDLATTFGAVLNQINDSNIVYLNEGYNPRLAVINTHAVEVKF
ncbi:MAG: hypothetical protein JHC33_01840 [Ignisphaera sp.]|jgi:hypothetical protein|nr:hypothetical protein [Ignisphaera sp.]